MFVSIWEMAHLPPARPTSRFHELDPIRAYLCLTGLHRRMSASIQLYSQWSRRLPSNQFAGRTGEQLFEYWVGALFLQRLAGEVVEGESNDEVSNSKGKGNRRSFDLLRSLRMTDYKKPSI